MNTIPVDANAIDAAWLEAALAPRHPGVRVRRVERISLDEVTNAHARLRVEYDEAAGAPERLFCKLLPSEPGRRAAIAATGMGLREARFYAELADRLTMRVPVAHAAGWDEASGAFALLMEDLATSGCTISDGTRGVPVDAAAGALADLAELHVRFEEPGARTRLAGWVPAPAPPSDYGTSRLRFALEHHRDRMRDAFAELAACYVADPAPFHAQWHAGPGTVIHGDVHIGNLFVDGADGPGRSRVGFLDWGMVVRSTPLRDLTYFLTMALSVEDRRAHERALIRHYLDVRRGLGGSPLGEDAVLAAYPVHAAYNVVASCQVVTVGDDATPARRKFAAAFLERAQAAVEDLDARQAVRGFAAG